METDLSRALRQFLSGPFNQLLVNTSGRDGATWEAELKKFLRKEPCWVKEEVGQKPAKFATRFLEPVLEVTIPASTTPFVAREKLVVDTSTKTGVRIRCLSTSFIKRFLSVLGKVEGPRTEQVLHAARLCAGAVDGHIFSELGGEANAETTLSEMFHLMEKQKGGEEGVLLNGHLANVFYIRDQEGVLCTVFVFWNGNGWYVAVPSGPISYGWHTGNRVFYRNAVPKSPVDVA